MCLGGSYFDCKTAIPKWLFLVKLLEYSFAAPVGRFQAIVTPAAAALALHTEWALKISVSIPAFPSSSFSHLAMVDEHTDLLVPMKRVVV